MNKYLSFINLTVILILLLIIPVPNQVKSQNSVSSGGGYKINKGDTVQYNVTETYFPNNSSVFEISFFSHLITQPILPLNTRILVKVVNKTVTENGYPQIFLNITAYIPKFRIDPTFVTNDSQEFLYPTFATFNEFQSYINTSIQSLAIPFPVTNNVVFISTGRQYGPIFKFKTTQDLNRISSSGNYYKTIIKTITMEIVISNNKTTTFSNCTDVSVINAKTGWLESLNETGNESGLVFDFAISRIHTHSILSQISNIIILGAEFISPTIVIGAIALIISYVSYIKNPKRDKSIYPFKKYVKKKFHLKSIKRNQKEFHVEKALEMLEEILEESNNE